MNNCLILITRDTVKFLTAKAAYEVSYTKETIYNLEIINPDRFYSITTDFISKNKLKPHNSIILLSEDLTYSANIKDANTLLETVPFDMDKVSVITMFSKDKKSEEIVVAVKSIYEELSKVLSELKWKILAVSVPQVATSQDLESKNVKKLWKYRDVFIKHNFVEVAKNGFFNMSFVSTLFLVINMAFCTYLLTSPKAMLVKKAIPEIPISIESTSTTILIEEESTAPVVEEVNKDQVKIQILNGSGVRGAATQTKDLLIPLGYTNIKTGDSKTDTLVYTTVYLNTDLPLVVQNEVYSEIGKLYKERKIEKVTLTKDSEFDIIIVTGVLYN